MKVDECTVLLCPLKFLWEKLRAYWSRAGTHQACKCHQRRKGISITAPNHTKGGKCKETNIFTSMRTTNQKQLPKIVRNEIKNLVFHELWQFAKKASRSTDLMWWIVEWLDQTVSWWSATPLLLQQKAKFHKRQDHNTLTEEVPGCLLGCVALCISPGIPEKPCCGKSVSTLL